MALYWRWNTVLNNNKTVDLEFYWQNLPCNRWRAKDVDCFDSLVINVTETRCVYKIKYTGGFTFFVVLLYWPIGIKWSQYFKNKKLILLYEYWMLGISLNGQIMWFTAQPKIFVIISNRLIKKNPYESNPVLKSRTIATVAAAWGPPLIRLLSSC